MDSMRLPCSDRLPQLRFVLGVTPAGPGRAWHAQLRALDDTKTLEFDSPFELLRYFEQLVDETRPEGRLR